MMPSMLAAIRGGYGIGMGTETNTAQRRDQNGKRIRRRSDTRRGNLKSSLHQCCRNDDGGGKNCSERRYPNGKCRTRCVVCNVDVEQAGKARYLASVGPLRKHLKQGIATVRISDAVLAIATFLIRGAAHVALALKRHSRKACHRAQADALEIEAGAKRRLADEYDAAQGRGEVATVGKRSQPEHLVGRPQGSMMATVHAGRIFLVRHRAPSSHSELRFPEQLQKHIATLDLPRIERALQCKAQNHLQPIADETPTYIHPLLSVGVILDLCISRIG